MGSLSFENVFRDELEQVEASRRLRLDESPPRRPPRDSLIGLAFSGGGIRSATFNLGVIQALARARLLHYFDYISTVSGGGYIGSWLMAWMHHQQIGIRKIEERLSNRGASLPSCGPRSQAWGPTRGSFSPKLQQLSDAAKGCFRR